MDEIKRLTAVVKRNEKQNTLRTRVRIKLIQ
jgi:hypothetical protein